MNGTENNLVKVRKLKNYKVSSLTEKANPKEKKSVRHIKINKEKKKTELQQQKQVFVNTTNDIFI